MATPKTLNNFYSRLKSVGVKLTHQYQLSFANVPIAANEQFQDITMWAQGPNLPGRVQSTDDIQYLGYPFNVATYFTMTNELNTTIRCDANLEIREAMLFWMSTISDADVGGASAGGGIKTASLSRAFMEIWNDRMDTVTHTYVLEGIYPVDVGDISLSNENPTIATFEAKFKYQFWKTTQSPNGGLLS